GHSLRLLLFSPLHLLLLAGLLATGVSARRSTSNVTQQRLQHFGRGTHLRCHLLELRHLRHLRHHLTKIRRLASVLSRAAHQLLHHTLEWILRLLLPLRLSLHAVTW
ncbi:hypothetical protein BRC94_02570, partial [Halobacteriales archaeon QS_5_70_17]